MEFCISHWVEFNKKIALVETTLNCNNIPWAYNQGNVFSLCMTGQGWKLILLVIGFFCDS